MFAKLLITKNVWEKVYPSSVRLLCAVIFLPVASVFGTELDCWFMFITPSFLYPCSVLTGLAVLMLLWLHVGPYCTEQQSPL